MQDHIQQFVSAADDVSLGFRIYPGPDDRLPLVCLPGLTRNARDFHDIALALSQDPVAPRKVVSIDYRGRGSSGRAQDKTSYNVVAEAQDLILVLDTLGIDKAIHIGTSRGGLILHVLATVAPERIAGLILNDIGPELSVDGLRDIQHYLQNTPQLLSWDDAALHLRHVHGKNFPALGDDDWTALAQSIYVEEDQRLVADCDPAIAEAFAALPLDGPLPDLWKQFDQFADIPMMVIRGEYSTLLTQHTVDAMRERRTRLETVTAEGQGHAPLLHIGVQDHIRRFLKDI